jgi:hypothetical protein
MLHDMLLDFLSQFEICHLREQPARDLLGEALFLIIGVTNGHVQDCLL